MYLFLSEDLEAEQKPEITEDDIEAVDLGILSIFQFSDGQFYELAPNGKSWLPLPRHKMNTKDN